jgi:hypothetical protein
MVQLDADTTSGCTDRDVGIKPSVLHPEVVEMTERLPGEEAELWMIALGFEFGNDDDRQDHPMLGEPADCCRIREQDAGVQDVGAATPARPGSGCSPRRPGGIGQPGGDGRRWLRSQRVRSRCGPAC